MGRNRKYSDDYIIKAVKFVCDKIIEDGNNINQRNYNSYIKKINYEDLPEDLSNGLPNRKYVSEYIGWNESLKKIGLEKIVMNNKRKNGIGKCQTKKKKRKKKRKSKKKKKTKNIEDVLNEKNIDMKNNENMFFCDDCGTLLEKKENLKFCKNCKDYYKL